MEDGTVPGSVNSSAFPRPVFALRSHRASFVSIFCGMHHSAAIDVGGKLYLFGANHHGQLGTGKYRPVPGAHQVRIGAHVIRAWRKCGSGRAKGFVCFAVHVDAILVMKGG